MALLNDLTVTDPLRPIELSISTHSLDVSQISRYLVSHRAVVKSTMISPLLHPEAIPRCLYQGLHSKLELD